MELFSFFTVFQAQKILQRRSPISVLHYYEHLQLSDTQSNCAASVQWKYHVHTWIPDMSLLLRTAEDWRRKHVKQRFIFLPVAQA